MAAMQMVVHCLCRPQEPGTKGRGGRVTCAAAVLWEQQWEQQPLLLVHSAASHHSSGHNVLMSQENHHHQKSRPSSSGGSSGPRPPTSSRPEGGVLLVHRRVRAEAHEGPAIVQRLIVPRRPRHAPEVKAQLLQQRPFVVHAPLGVVLPLACLRVALHQGLNHAGPARFPARGRAVGRRPEVCARQDIGHRALVAVEVVTPANAVCDVDANVREGPHLGKNRPLEGLNTDATAPPRSGVQVALVEVLVNGGLHVAAQVPHLVSAFDDKGARIKTLRSVRDPQLTDEARVVQGDRGHVGRRDLIGRRRHGIGALRLCCGHRDRGPEHHRASAHGHGPKQVPAREGAADADRAPPSPSVALAGATSAAR
mmetsp:Transcript_984/g.2992  ORF Transcript_984/g.2992 Transcript_984/m.2992 type:complete len:367 (+) Transcript_984:197-1297(+)